MSSVNKWSRRSFLKLTTFAAIGGVVGGVAVPLQKRWQQPGAQVGIFKAADYAADLADMIYRGVQQYPQIVARAKGGTVVLKPNVVDHYRDHPVNTHPAVVVAAAVAFQRLGAAQVIVGEGPGHRRDTEMLLEQSGLDDALREEHIRFVDLNLDAISRVPLVSQLTGLNQLFFPNTILGADVVVSMPKLKTHHWAGVTLSLKNMFGTVPGVKYGWPKNWLHWHGISESIVDINAAIQPHFAIVDGVVGMEGDGPLHGTAVPSGVIVMGDNLTAVDATAARIMGVYPEKVDYLRYMISYGGTINPGRIAQIGEDVAVVKRPFALLPHMAFIQDKPSFLETLLLSGL